MLDNLNIKLSCKVETERKQSCCGTEIREKMQESACLFILRRTCYIYLEIGRDGWFVLKMKSNRLSVLVSVGLYLVPEFACFLQILSLLFVIITSSKNLASRTLLSIATMEICCMNHGRCMMKKDMLLQHLLLFGTSA